MHTHQSLFTRRQERLLRRRRASGSCREVARAYIGGLLDHARAFVAVTNPLVNSYKRLVPGYEAPINVAWSEKNRSPLVRVPARRGVGTRCEVRIPDPSCNPYLALAVMLASGLDGIERGLDCGEPVNRNIFEMSQREKRRLKIDQLPANLDEALDLPREGRGASRRPSASTSSSTSCSTSGRSGPSTSRRSTTGSWSATSTATDPVTHDLRPPRRPADVLFSRFGREISDSIHKR